MFKKIYILIDCKVGIKNLDIDIFDIISNSNKLFSLILTKVDKCSKSFRNEQKDSILSLMKNYSDNFSQIYLSSSKKNIGIIDIQKDIFNLSTHYEI